MSLFLLERDSQLAELHCLLESAASGDGSLVFLGGEAGVGKTSVIRKLLAEVRGRARILYGACDPASTPSPLWPLREMASTAEWAPGESVALGAPRDEIFQAALAELRCGPAPSIVVIEDVHWADDATYDLLRFLGRRVADTRSLVIASYRDDDARQLRALRLVLGDLATSARVNRISIPPLSYEAVAELAIGRPLDPVDLFNRTRGNPFFVTEVLSAGGDVPATVKDAVLSRVARLTTDARHIVDLAAVRGPAIERSLLGSVVDSDIEPAIEECIASGIIECGKEQLTFKHELTREAILGELSSSRRAHLSGQIFRTLESGGAAVDPALMAHFAEEAGLFHLVSQHADAAGDRARELRSYREASTQYKRALGYSQSLSAQSRSELLAKLADVTYFCGRGTTGVEVLVDLIAAQRESGDRARLAEHLAWLAAALAEDGHKGEALGVIDEAIEVARDLPEQTVHGQVYATHAHILMLNGQHAKAITWGDRAHALAERYGDQVTAIRALISIGSAQLFEDEEAGTRTLEGCASLAREIGFDTGVAHALGNLGSYFAESYRIDRSRRYLEEMIAFTTERDLDCWRRFGEVCLSLSLLYSGNWIEAASYAPAMVHAESGCLENQLGGLVVVGRIRARRGDPDISAVLDGALALLPPDSSPYSLSQVRAARAEAACLNGDYDLARQEASIGLTAAIQTRDPCCTGELAYLMSIAGEPVVLPFEPFEPFAMQLAGDWEAANRAWLNLGCPYEAARALADADKEQPLRQALAEFERLGAQPMAGFVIRKLRDLGVASVPRGPRPSTRANPFRLTPREAEVLDQVSQGWNNAEIADRLYLSPKTVEHHVSSILAKLDVSSRREAIQRVRGRDSMPIGQVTAAMV